MGIDLHSACAQVMAWQQHLAGVSLRWSETEKAESLAMLSAECFRLHRSLEEVLESSQLLKMLPEELLLRIFTRLDAKTLGTLESVSRRFGSGLVDRAVAHAAVEQHGEKLAALQPKYLSVARRLWCLEVAVEAGTSFVENAAQQVESNEAGWVWPVTSPFANEDQGAHALATVLAASASPRPPPPPPPPPVTPPPEQDAVDASPRQKALVKLVSKLATGGERGFVEPESPAGAVQWLADELHREALSVPDRTFTLDAIKTLLGEVPGTYCKLEPKEKLVLIRATWQHCNKAVGTRDGLTQAITRGLQLYSQLKQDNAKFPEKIELLQKIHQQQAQQPERWANDQRQQRLHMPEQSHFQVTLMLAGAMRENGMCPSAVALLRQVAAKCSGDEERSHLWARGCIDAARELRRLGELGPCEQLYREILGVQERICKPTDLRRISVEVHLVSLLVECGNLLEAETRQRSLAAVCRQIADELAAKKLEQLIQQDTGHHSDAIFQLDGFVHAFESLAGHSSTPRVVFSFNIGFEKDLGLYQLLMRQGKHEEAQQVVAPAMLDLYFAMLSESWDGAWFGNDGYGSEGMLRAEPREWAARREQLEELLSVDQVQKSVEAKFSALVLKLVAEVGMVHASTLFMRGRQAFVLQHYGKLQDARAHLETLVTDFGTSIAPGAAIHNNWHKRSALYAVAGLEKILGALGLREERDVLRRRCVEAEGDPGKLEEHDLRIRVAEGVRDGNWVVVNSSLSSLLEHKCTDESGRYFKLVGYGNLIAWSMQGHQLDAEPLLREARELELDRADKFDLAGRNLDLARILFVLAAADFDKQVNSTAMESRLKEAEQVLTEAIMVDVGPNQQSLFPNKQRVAICKYLLALVLKLAAAVLKLKYDSALEEALEGTLNDVAAHAVATSSELLARQRNERLDKLEQATRLMEELVSCHNGEDADTFHKKYTSDFISDNVPMPDDVCKIPDHDGCCQAVARLLQLQERHEEASEWWEEWEEGMSEGGDEDEEEDEETTQDEDAQGNAKRVRHDTR